MQSMYDTDSQLKIDVTMWLSASRGQSVVFPPDVRHDTHSGCIFIMYVNVICVCERVMHVCS